jgi:DNA repair protein RecO (recombination protein O)
MPTYTTTAITLQHYPLGEHDRLLELFTREHGLKRIVAKGARRAKSKLGARTEPLIHATWFLGKGRNLDVVAQCETVHAHRGLRADLDRLMAGLYLAELTGHSVIEAQPHPDLFDLFAASLLALEVAESPELVTAWYELAVLNELGYAPELGVCAQCAGDLDSGACGFSGEIGGCLCESCQAVLGAPILSRRALDLLRRLSDVELTRLLPHALAPALVGQARAAIASLLEAHAGRPFKTLAVGLGGGLA